MTTSPSSQLNMLQYLGPSSKRPLVPFGSQQEIINGVKIPWPGLDSKGNPYPTIHTVRCGRRYGKTTMGEVLVWLGLFQDEDDFGPPVVKVTADTEEHGMKIWRKFIWHLENTPLHGFLDTYNKEYNLVTLKTGATAQLLSANNPNALSGDGVTKWVIDEAQFLSMAAWVNLFPSTADRNGVISMLGVAEGEGPFKECSIKGMDKNEPAFADWHRPTRANPFVPQWRIDFARGQLSPTKFRQLYLAEWVGELGHVFRNIAACVRVKWQPKLAPMGYGYVEAPKSGTQYYGGLDLARLSDWTVYSIWDSMGNLVAWDRFNLVSWELQKERIYQLSKLYNNAATCVDSTGIGDPIVEDLMKKGMTLTEYKISSHTQKKMLVDELAVRISGAQLAFPNLQVLVRELSTFEAKRTDPDKPSSPIKYEAPSGGTDDWVMSMALACQLLPSRVHVQRPSVSGSITPDELVTPDGDVIKLLVPEDMPGPYDQPSFWAGI